jgi:hypothetical protein
MWSVGYRYTYTLAFEYADTATYDQLVALYWSNASDQTSTTFTWSGGPWAGATAGVEVFIDSISTLSTTYPDITRGDYTITLVEVEARTE